MEKESCRTVYEPVHTLSKKSHRLQRNFFLWSNRMVGGLHLDESFPISPSTLRRWLLLLYKKDALEDIPNADVFELRPVEISFAHRMLFNYTVSPAGEPIDITSTDPLPPGDIGIFRSGGPILRKLPLKTAGESFIYLKQRVVNVPGLEWGPMSPPSVKEVKARDGDRCVITGIPSSEASLVVTWVYPPFVPSFISRSSGPIDMAPYLSSSNALTMRADLAERFERNEFGIDVEDGYRIRFFCPSAKANLTPRTHLDVTALHPTMHLDECLRQHFIRCLLVNFLGGDISTIYEDVNPDEFFEERGVFDDQFDPSDPEWHTELGKEALALLKRMRARAD